MKPSPSDRVEIIRLVEESRLPARRQLEILGIARSRLSRWYDRLPGGWPRSFGGLPVSTTPCLEPHPASGAGANHRHGARLPGAIAARAGGSVHG